MDCTVFWNYWVQIILQLYKCYMCVFDSLFFFTVLVSSRLQLENKDKMVSKKKTRVV